MSQAKRINQTKNRDIYALYRDKFRRPELTKKEIDEMRVNMQAIARAVCERAWGKQFY